MRHLDFYLYLARSFKLPKYISQPLIHWCILYILYSTV